jgi:hypothetical protein
MKRFAQISISLGFVVLVVAFTGSIALIVFPTLALTYVGLGLVQAGMWVPKLVKVVQDSRKNYREALATKAENASI